MILEVLGAGVVVGGAIVGANIATKLAKKHPNHWASQLVFWVRVQSNDAGESALINTGERGVELAAKDAQATVTGTLVTAGNADAKRQEAQDKLDGLKKEIKPYRETLDFAENRVASFYDDGVITPEEKAEMETIATKVAPVQTRHDALQLRIDAAQATVDAYARVYASAQGAAQKTAAAIEEAKDGGLIAIANRAADEAETDAARMEAGLGGAANPAMEQLTKLAAAHKGRARVASGEKRAVNDFAKASSNDPLADLKRTIGADKVAAMPDAFMDRVKAKIAAKAPAAAPALTDAK